MQTVPSRNSRFHWTKSQNHQDLGNTNLQFRFSKTYIYYRLYSNSESKYTFSYYYLKYLQHIQNCKQHLFLPAKSCLTERALYIWWITKISMKVLHFIIDKHKKLHYIICITYFFCRCTSWRRSFSSRFYGWHAKNLGKGPKASSSLLRKNDSSV